MNDHESKFVTSFVARERQEHFAFILGSAKRRAQELDRLNHTRDFDPRFTEWVDGQDEILELIKTELTGKTVGLISADPKIDARTLTLSEALPLFLQANSGTVLLGIPGRLAFYRDEVGKRHAILKRPASAS